MNVATALRPALRARLEARLGQRRRAAPADSNAASPAALVLLGEVLARLPGIAQPVIQIVSACPSGGTAQVARELAVAAAGRFGRTLLVSAGGPGVADKSHVRGLSWLMAELRGAEPPPDTGAIMPDIAVPGLYHTRADPQDANALPLDAWRGNPLGFKMIVLESPAIAGDPRTIAAAAQCHGSILVVAAGLTRLDEIRVAARQLSSAGALLLGTVLHDAPSIALGFGRRRLAR